LLYNLTKRGKIEHFSPLGIYNSKENLEATLDFPLPGAEPTETFQPTALFVKYME
jgi:hypothetical protein